MTAPGQSIKMTMSNVVERRDAGWESDVTYSNSYPAPMAKALLANDQLFVKTSEDFDIVKMNY